MAGGAAVEGGPGSVSCRPWVSLLVSAPFSESARVQGCCERVVKPASGVRTAPVHVPVDTDCFVALSSAPPGPDPGSSLGSAWSPTEGMLALEPLRGLKHLQS